MLKFPRKNSAGVTKDPSGPVCASCGKALKADHTYRIEDKKYCEDCYQRIRYGKAGSMMRAVRQQSASPIAERLRAARERLAQEKLVKKELPPRTADDSEAWLVRNLSGRLLIRASELKPQFRHLAGFHQNRQSAAALAALAVKYISLDFAPTHFFSNSSIGQKMVESTIGFPCFFALFICKKVS